MGNSATPEQYCKTVPIGDDGFVISFDLQEGPKAQAFFEEYGFVVIRNVLSDQDIQDTLDEFWETAQSHKVSKEDPNTWDPYWKKNKFSHLGIMGMWSELTPMQLKNRQNPNVYEAFKIILKEEQLWVDHDRLGLMRPTKNIVFPGSPLGVEKPEWRTKDNWLHLDCNPIHGYASIGSFTDNRSTIDFTQTLIIQALITLSDARTEDGGFHCVPGAHKISTGLVRNDTSLLQSGSNVQFPVSHPLLEKVQKIPVRKGCLLAWTSLLPHGNHPNYSSDWRAVQYIRMMPVGKTPYSPLLHNSMYFTIPKQFNPTPLGKKLFGLQSW